MLMIFPTGDRQGKNVATYQPVTLAAMEGLFETSAGAPIAILGQPDMEKHAVSTIRLVVPKALSFLTYQRWEAEVKGLTHFRATSGPTTSRCCITAITSWLGSARSLIAAHGGRDCSLWRRPLLQRAGMLWVLMLIAAVSLHRDHGGLDHRGGRPATVADLRLDADDAGRVHARFGWQRAIHA